MINLNLLPIKEELKQKQTIRSLFLFVLIFIFIIIVHFIYYNHNEGKIDEQREIVTQLQKDVDKYKNLLGDLKKEKLKREEALRRIDAINSLEDLRSTLLKTLHEINQSIPSKTWITSLKKKGKTIELLGGADSYDSVTKFARSLKAKSDLFKGLEMRDVHSEVYSGKDKMNRKIKYLSYDFKCTLK